MPASKAGSAARAKDHKKGLDHAVQGATIAAMPYPHKKHPAIYTPHTPHPAVTPELAAFFNAVAPQAPVLPATRKHSCPDGTAKPSAIQPMPYSQHGSDVGQLAELRIRQWIVQQEQDLRKQQYKRLFGS